MNIKNELLNILEKLDAIHEKQSQLNDELSNYDKRVNDLYHNIETNNGINPMKLYAELKTVLQERREVKDNLNAFKVFNTSKGNVTRDENARVLLRDKLNKLPKKYHNRYYSKDFKELE